MNIQAQAIAPQAGEAHDMAEGVFFVICQSDEDGRPLSVVISREDLRRLWAAEA
jgi:hypothetical protein